MKPELIDGLVDLVESLRGVAFTKANTDSLKEALALAKAAIPSGQVAEDREALMRALQPWGAGEHKERLIAAAKRLAAQAQSAENYRGMWQDAERGRVALLAERERLKKEVASREHDLMLHFEAKNEALRKTQELEARCASLSAAGQVLSEHVDKEQCPCLTDSPMGAERQCPEHDAPEWTMRDEFAKAALQGILANPTTQEKPDVCAKAAYIAADAMIAERGTVPKAEFTREAVESFNGCQNDRERVCYGAGYDKGLTSMNGACWEAVQSCLNEEGFNDGGYLRGRLKKRVERASP